MFGFIASIGSAITSIGSALGTMASSLGAFASNALKVVGPWLGPISNIVSAIAQMLGIFKKEDNVEELGAKALQEDAKKPEDFNSTAEYIDHLRNDIKIDREKFDKAGDVEKIARTAVGTSIAMKGINETKGFDIPTEAWLAMGKLGLDETKTKEIDKIIETFKDGNLGDFAKYVDGKLEDIDKNTEIGDSLATMYKDLEPGSSEQDIEQKVMQAQVGDIKPEDLSK